MEEVVRQDVDFQLELREFKANEEFFKSDNFNKCISGIIFSNTEKELKNKFEELVKEMQQKTNMEFNYDFPMIWDNWGLNSQRYLAHGGPQYGFASDTTFDRWHSVDIQYVLCHLFSLIYETKKRHLNIETGSVWEKMVKDDLDGEQKINGYSETVIDSYVKSKINILGKIWLEHMSKNDLRKLQIRCRSGILDFREQVLQESIFLDDCKVFPLITYALELAAQHNLDTNDKIYFSEDQKYSSIQLIVPTSIFINSELEPLISEDQKFWLTKLTLEELVKSFEELVKVRTRLSGVKNQLIELTEEEKQFSQISNEDYFKQFIVKKQISLLRQANNAQINCQS